MKQTLEHPNEPAEAAVAETRAKGLVSVENLSAGKERQQELTRV